MTHKFKAEDFLSRWFISGFGTIGGVNTDTNAISYYPNTPQTQAATKSTNIAFKAQWSHFWLGTENGAATWNTPPTEPIPYHVNVWSVGLDFIF